MFEFIDNEVRACDSSERLWEVIGDNLIEYNVINVSNRGLNMHWTTKNLMEIIVILRPLGSRAFAWITKRRIKLKVESRATPSPCMATELPRLLAGWVEHEGDHFVFAFSTTPDARVNTR